MHQNQTGSRRIHFGFSRKLTIALLSVSFSVSLSDATAQDLPEFTVPPETSSSSCHTSCLPDAPAPQADELTVSGLPVRVLRDELHLLQFPRYTSKSDLKWLLPLTGATVASFAFDEKTMTEVVSSNPSFNQSAIDVSDGLRDGFIAAPIAMFATGHLNHDDHLRESGLLAGEAMIDSYLIGDVIKLVSFRERPLTDRAEGSFYRSSAGFNSSFISGHSLTAWSSAAVIASEYRNPWLRAGLYTAAGGVSLTRVFGQEHFPSDVLLGSAAGWLIGRYVYHRHHHKHSAEWWATQSPAH